VKDVHIPKIPIILTDVPFQSDKCNFHRPGTCCVHQKSTRAAALNSAGVDVKTDCFSDVQSYTACTQVRRAGQSMCTYIPLHDIPEHNVSMHTAAHWVNRYHAVCSK